MIQVYESLMFMDFAQDQMRKLQGFSVGAYTRLDAELLPPLFIAFSDHVSQPIEVPHTNLRANATPKSLRPWRRSAN